MKTQMHKTYYILCVFLFALLTAQAQDTIYYNQNWKPTTKELAHYYRPLPLKKQGDFYLVKDYYNSGVLQMEALSTQADKDVFQGKVTYYYPTGTIEKAAHFIDGKQEGETTSYFNDGTLQAQGILKNNTYWNGTFPYIYDGKLSINEYQDGARVARYTLYQSNKKIAKKQTIKYYDQVQQSIYYDESGKELSTVHYKNGSGMYLEPLDGTFQYFATNAENLVTGIVGTGAIKIIDSLKTITTTLYQPKITITGTYKNGFLHNGEFYKDGRIITYKDGNKNGEERCCFNGIDLNTTGMNNDGRPQNGRFFDPRKRKVTAYKNGRLHGKQITYAADLTTIIAQEEYNLGIEEGTFIYTNEHTGERLTCIFKNGVPYNGRKFIYDEYEYKDGHQIKQTQYDNTTGKIEKITYYTQGEYGSQTTKIEQYKDGAVYVLNYKNGSAYSGIETQNYGFFTYENGSYNGPYEVTQKDYKETGNYVNFDKEGEIIFEYKDITYTCIYKKNKPYTGTDVNIVRGIIAEYKEGKLHGNYIKEYKNYEPYDKIVGQYKEDVPIGTFTVYKNEEEVDAGEYKKGKPYHGIFYNNKNYERYTKGTIDFSYEMTAFNKYSVQKNYDNGIIVEETVDDLKNNKYYRMTYKNGKPDHGDRFEKRKERYYLTSYSNGKKEGRQQIFKYPFSNLEEVITYKNDQRNGITTIYLDNKTYTCTYKNDQPINGQYLKNYKHKQKELITVVDGQRTEVHILDGYNPTIVGSGTYKNGKPYHGFFIASDDEHQIIKEYTDGIYTSTYLDGVHKTPRSGTLIIHHTATDTIKNNRFSVIVDYANEKKQTGSASYLDRDDKPMGTVQFNNNIITQAQVDFSSVDADDSQLIYEDQLYIKVHIAGDLYLKAPMKNDTNYPVAFYIAKPFGYFEPIKEAFFIDNKTQKVVAIIELKNKRPFNGINIQKSFADENEIHVITYKDGKEIDKETMLVSTFLKKHE